jgi:hypothetical protein
LETDWIQDFTKAKNNRGSESSPLIKIKMKYQTIKNTIMKFLPNTDYEQIVTALMSGQKTLTLDNVEIHLEKLSHDTKRRKEIQANKMAEEILFAIRS